MQIGLVLELFQNSKRVKKEGPENLNFLAFGRYHKLAHFLFDHVFEHAFNFKLAHLFFPFQIRLFYDHVIFLQI